MQCKNILIVIFCKHALTNLHRFLCSLYAGVLRYPSPYAPMIRPAFPPRPMGVIPPMLRPPVAGIRGPITSPFIRPPPVPSVTLAEKPQTTVYVGKISSTVENDFILSLLQVRESILGILPHPLVFFFSY